MPLNDMSYVRNNQQQKITEVRQKIQIYRLSKTRVSIYHQHRINFLQRITLMGLLFCIIFFCVTSGYAAPPEFSFSNGILTIKTDRYEIDWQNGSMIRLVSFLPVRQQLTLSSNAMKIDQLPNGLGSFYQQKNAGKLQHGINRRVKIPTIFPAQHPPDEKSIVTHKLINGGVEITYAGLHEARDDVLRQQLTVDPITGDLIIRQSGFSRNPGVFGLAFSLINLRPDLKFIVPFFAGEKWGAHWQPGYIRTIAWAQFWSAALIIGEIGGGATFSVWAQDPKMRPKYFHHYNSVDVQGLGFESSEDSPYDQKENANSIEWRFNTFSGSWMKPAKRYKDWMIEAYGINPRAERSAQWINDIALFWPNGDFSQENLLSMAKMIDPKHVLIHNWGTLPQFNRRIPEYIPQDTDYAKKTEIANNHGYHIGGYTSMLLVDVETHSKIMENFDLDYRYNGLNSEKPTEPQSWLVHIHPGSEKWRNFYSEKMTMFSKEYGVSLLYQDVSGGQVGSAGTIDGRTLANAVIAIEDDIIRRNPQVALMGEFWNEINAIREDFGLINYLDWFDEEFKKHISERQTVHPILSYLFSDSCVRMAYSRPLRNIKRFHAEENINEVTGAIPYWNTGLDDQSGESLITMNRAKLWADGFRPYFPENWEDDLIAYMKNHRDEIIRYIAIGESTYCYRGEVKDKNLLYARVTGVDHLYLNIPVRIQPWIAYNDNGPIGLDKNKWYSMFPGAPAELPIVITSLPQDAVINGARLTQKYTMIELAGIGEGLIKWDTNRPFLYGISKLGRFPSENINLYVELPETIIFIHEEIQPNVQISVDKWLSHVVSNGWITGHAKLINRRVKLEDGSFLDGYQVLPPTGGENVEAVIEGIVDIPNTGSATLSAVTALLSDCSGDGVNFVVRINGKEVWRNYRKDTGFKYATIPLKDYTGKKVVLTLGLDCGKSGYNISCDESFWGDIKIVTLADTYQLSPPKGLRLIK